MQKEKGKTSGIGSKVIANVMNALHRSRRLAHYIRTLFIRACGK